MKKRHSVASGFTLLELMVTLAVAAVILGFAVPNFRSFLLNNRMTGAANDLVAAAHLARTESIKRHVQTVFCLSSNPTATVPSCNGNGTQGWIVFVDVVNPDVAAATDNNGQPDAGEEIVLRHGAIPDTISVTSRPDGNSGYVAYSAAGFSRPIGLSVDIQSLVLCDSRGNVATYGAANSAARAFRISETGRPSVTRAVADITALGGC